MRIDVTKKYDRSKNVQFYFEKLIMCGLHFGKRLVTFTLILVIFRKFKKILSNELKKHLSIGSTQISTTLIFQGILTHLKKYKPVSFMA